MNTPEANLSSSKTLWHVTIDLAYEGQENESSQDGIERVLAALRPLIENGSDIKQVFVMRLPEKELISPNFT
jgi:hypothetical protein